METTETKKAYKRRKQTLFFDKFVKAKVIDIGCGQDLEQLIVPNARPFDYSLGCGDATFMDGIKDEAFDTVYASHILEHLEDQETALKNWFRILNVGGHLIICVPDRDLYEKRKKLPSLFAFPVHKRFYKLWDEDLPHTYSLMKLIKDIYKDCASVVWAQECDSGYNYSLPKDRPPVGEYQIEVVIKKGKNL